jgi:hypothetical protein
MKADTLAIHGGFEGDTNNSTMAMIMAAIALCMLGILGCNGGSAVNSRAFEPAVGDLLFLDGNCGEMCDAIKAVTTGYNGANFSHVGIVARNEKGEPVVIEAVSKGVVVTNLRRFLERSLDSTGQPKVIVGRLKKSHQYLVPEAVRQAVALEGRPYDKAFVIGNDAYYCSELVYEAFRRANNGNPVFALEPMTFKTPGSDETMPVWRDYFAKLGIDVPEGQPGINPGGISRSPILDIVYSYTENIKKQQRGT